MKIKVLLVNTSSVHNSGDTAILLAQVELLKKHYPRVKITSTSRTPSIDQKVFDTLGIDLLSPIWPAPARYDGLINKIFFSIINLLNIASKMKFLKAVKNSCFVICSGGGYFYSTRKKFPGFSFIQNYLQVKIPLWYKKPVIFFPQSYGPFNNSIAVKLFINLIKSNHVVRIFAREYTSFNLLNVLLKNLSDKIEICPDPTFFISKNLEVVNPTIKINLPKPIVALTLKYWTFPYHNNKKEIRKKQDQYLKCLKEICLRIYQEYGGSVIIYPQARGPEKKNNDRIISKIFIEKIKDIIPIDHRIFIDLPDHETPQKIFEILSQVDMIIATRLHSALFAIESQIPFIVISYFPKGKGIMKMLGLDEFSFDISDLIPDLILSKIKNILDNPKPIIKLLRNTALKEKKDFENKIIKTIKTLKIN